MMAVIVILSIKLFKDVNRPQNYYSENNFNSDNASLTVYQFCLDEWRETYPEFSCNINVGVVTNPFTAVEKAEEIWSQKLSFSQEMDLCAETHRVVYYDIENKCWWVHAVLPNNLLGVVPNVLIEENGNVLAVWIG